MAVVVAASLTLASCADDDEDAATTEATTAPAADDGEVPVPEAPAAPTPAGAVGDAIDYHSEDEGWALVVTATEARCDVELGDDASLAPAEGQRYCLVTLQAENAADVPNTDEFLFASTLLASDDERYPVNTQASEQYLVEHDLGPTVVEPGTSADIPLLFSLPVDAEPQFLFLQGQADDLPVVIELSGA